MNKIFTIGHSTHTINKFISMLKQYSVNTIVDVRSVPYSRFNSQYNKEELKAKLKANGICYVFMGQELGARYEEESLLFEDGAVDFKKVQDTENFLKGIDRLKKGIQKGYSISLMCSEKNPIECHRFGLVSEYLSKNDFEIAHITPTEVISQKELELKLMEKYKLGGLFADAKESLVEAYKLLTDLTHQGIKVA